MQSTKINSPIYAKKEYGFYTLSADQTTDLAAGDSIKFDTVEGNIPVSSYQMTLKANVRYKLKMGCRIGGSGASSVLTYQWYDSTNSSYFGSRGIAIVLTYTSHNSFQNIAYAVITPTTDIIVELRIAVNAAITDIYAMYSYAFIESMEAVIPVHQIPVSTINGVEHEIKTKYLTGTSDADATTNVAHGISDHDKIIHCSASFKYTTTEKYYMYDFQRDLNSATTYRLAYDETNVILETVGTSFQGNLYRIKIEYYE